MAWGVITSLQKDESNEVSEILEMSGYVGVRDKKTYESLALTSCNVHLIPDTAIVISDMWDKSYLDRQYRKKFWDCPARYIIMQCNHSMKNYINEIIHIIDEIYKQYNTKILLLPIGNAVSHGDIEVLSKVHKRTLSKTLYFGTRSLEEVTYLIENAFFLFGTSLHANLVAFSYNVGSVLIADKDTKNYNYFQTWLQDSSVRLLSTMEFLSMDCKELLFDPQDTINVLEEQKNIVKTHFSEMCDFIKAVYNKC